MKTPTVRADFRFFVAAGVALALVLVTWRGARAQQPEGEAPPPALPFPARKADAPTGSEFYNEIKDMARDDRERRAYYEFINGNIPDFLRALVPITVSAQIGGQTRTLTFWTTPDYMAIGTDADFFRLPMSADLAQRVASAGHSLLTTRKLTNDIYTAATVKLAPATFNPTQFDIDSVEIFYQHNTRIEQQRAGQTLGALVGGIKKDIVITPQILQRPPPPRVAIYGWHQLNGQPIQPLSLVHVHWYHDYSHGVRLVLDAAELDGEPVLISDLLQDAQLHPLVSDEGAFPLTSYPINATFVQGGFKIR